MGLFELLNPNLFKPLAGRYKEIFADLLDLIWERCRHSKDYSMEKDEMTELAERYFEALAVSMTLEDDDEETGVPGQVMLTREPHLQALWSLNRLRFAGWLEDVDGGYGEPMRTAVIAANVPVLQAFNSILRPQTVTYSGKLFKAYQLFQTLGQEESPYENILKEVSESMEELNTALRNLNASIGTYIEQLTRNKTPQEVLELFDEYEEKIVIASYHRFKTSDNLFFYRTDLQNALDACEDLYLEELVQDYSKVEQVEPDQALPKVLQLIRTVRDDLEIMSELMQEIDKNHLNYRKRAVQRAQFMLLTDSSIQGTLNELLKYYAKTITEASELDEVDNGPLTRRWKLYPAQVLGKNFLKTPSKPSKRTRIEPLLEQQELTEEELLEAQKQLLRYAAAAVTQENVNSFAKNALGEKSAVKVSDIALEQPEQFVKIIALHTYSESESRAYDIELQPAWVKCGKYRFQDFLLKKKV